VAIQFQKAIKHAAKARVALIGPAGSGKSMTMLKLARALAGPAGRIAAIDSEHGSLSKYAPSTGAANNTDTFDFDVNEFDETSVENFLLGLDAAETAGYDVFCCDSLSHFWMGKGGALEFVDMASKRHRDQMGGWKDFRPHERMMVDRMIASPCHVIVTMRTKTDYQEVTGADGKKKRVKVGLAPVQREGLEYEFDLVGYMDDENTLIVDKTRCSVLAQKAFPRPGPKEFAPFIAWLTGTERPLPAEKPVEKPSAAPKSALVETGQTAGKMSESQYIDHLSKMSECADVATLKGAFGAAWTAAKKIGDAEAQKGFQTKYEQLKMQLGAREGVVA
jgi:AAA domain